jgi:uncharacterized protein (DUF1800 family)
MAKTELPPLDKVDPAKAWQAWEPGDKDPFDLKWAGHLYRRAAFGASLPELRESVKKGLDGTFDTLFRKDQTADDRHQFLLTQGKRVAEQGNPFQLRGWWLYAMINTLQPAREKLTLFWHNHFATSISKVQRTTLMFNQNQLMREYALEKFQPFLLAMSKDAAMLVWLDSNSNVKGKPNENYAREIQELFSLGVGNYTEKDIREAARAFTGWHTEGERFDFVRNLHDDGEKTFHEQTGNWDGEDIVRIIMEQKACARYLVRKLYRFYFSEAETPPDALIEPLAKKLRDSDYDLGALVKTMLRSRHFYSDYAYRQRIKSPVEFTLGAVKAVGQGFVTPQSLVGKMETMGQQLFAPPNVKGWEGGQAWLNTATVLARANFAQMLSNGTGQINLGDPEARVAVAVDPAAIVRREKLTDPKDVVGLLVDILLQGDVSDPERDMLVNFVKEGEPKETALDQRIRETVHTIMTMPEYQLA